MKYNPAKFALAFFAGKLLIGVSGAFLGGFGEQFLSGYVSQFVMVTISIVLTGAIAVVLLKADLSTIAEWILKKLGWIKSEEHFNEHP
jgi:hypothetical protein